MPLIGTPALFAAASFAALGNGPMLFAACADKNWPNGIVGTPRASTTGFVMGGKAPCFVAIYVPTILTSSDTVAPIKLTYT